MIAPPHAGNLRRRRHIEDGGETNNNVNARPIPVPAHGPAQAPMGDRDLHHRRINSIRTSHMYCLISTVIAILAIITSSGSSNSAKSESIFHENTQSQNIQKPHSRNDEFSIENMARAAAAAISHDNEMSIKEANPDNSASNVGLLNNMLQYTFFFNDDKKKQKNTKKTYTDTELNPKSEQFGQKPFQFPLGLRWIDSATIKLREAFPQNSKSDQSSSTRTSSRSRIEYTTSIPFFHFFLSMVDDAILYPNEDGGATQVIDKILTSTPRLLAIANLLLAVTYLLHSFVADLFLGSTNLPMSGNAQNQNMNDFARNMSADDQRHRRAGRERLGGFLIFKLLLISAVVEPDTLDLLILLSWYTLLSFLRSLSHLASCTTNHTSQAGLPPRRGVLRLLLLVLCCNCTAAACCVALFHGAGLGMVLLLTCDCALLALDVFVHLARHANQVLEEKHTHSLSQIEEQQIRLHAINRESTDATDQETIRDQIRYLDRQFEALETNHTRHLDILDKFIFTVELMSALLTICHFLHIWSLHGLTCGLVDGVLALHLHTAISAASRKIAERRNMYKISRDLDGFFEDASEADIEKASMSGDVCCICLCTMCVGNVKKVGCGHLYHSHCLREVVERARSIEAARCPLCRASVLHGSQMQTNNGLGENLRNQNNNLDQLNIDGINNNQNPPDLDMNMQQRPQAHEHALFRFSTEGILPAWLPLPAFSFEVVRRPPIPADMDNNNNINNNMVNNNNNENPQPGQQPQNNNDNRRDQSFWRRLLVFAGAVPMSPEEEASALAQLVDMFPQYDRSALLHELRDRNSTEAVVESILMGTFTGVARGAGANFVVPPAEDAPLLQGRGNQPLPPTNTDQQTVGGTDDAMRNATGRIDQTNANDEIEEDDIPMS